MTDVATTRGRRSRPGLSGWAATVYDVIFLNVVIVDGSGAPARAGHVGIADRRIAWIGDDTTADDS